ncbi:MAG TPA: hypothetical protein PK854_06280 [Oscillospiraceae bacterium]|nr:hypothetical protein [Oscillospiraceae bacterium]HPS34853.1 hypothetical protein [Oscillospiraceae bacterium]
MKKIISMILAVCILAGLPLIFAGCLKIYPLAKGTKATETIQTKKEYTFGSAEKIGWELEILPNTFDDEINLTMAVLSKEEAVAYQNDAFELIGSPVKITAGSEDSIRLNRPVTVTMRISEELRISRENADDYLVGYYTGDGWEYIFPDYIKAGDGYIVFETYHFSLFATVKLTDAEKVKLYAEKMALQTWEDEQREKAMTEKLQTMFNESFEKMGITDESVRGKLFNAIAKEADFGTLTVAAKQGDLSDFTAKCGEMASNALIKHFALTEDDLAEKLSAKGAAVTTGLLKGAAAAAKGEYKDAAKEMASAFIGYFPAGRAYQAAIEVTQASIDTWKDYELDAAYQSYAGTTKNGQYGYKVSPGDWAALEIQMRGYLNRLQSEAKDRYCEANGISHSELDKDEQLCLKIENEASLTLKKMFERRLAAELEIAKKEKKYGNIIEGFEKSGLLKRGSLGFDGMDVQDRLRSLFAARRAILELFGGSMPVLSAGDSAENNLNQAIGMWLSYGTKNRGEFYQWLKEKGYNKRSEVLTDAGAAWMLSGTNINKTESITEEMVKANDRITAHSYEIYPGGGSLSTTKKWMDEKEYTVSASFAFTVPERIKPGEEFEITLSAADAGSNNPDAYIQHGIQAVVWVNYGGSWFQTDSLTAATETFRLSDSPSASVMKAETTSKFTAPAKADGFTIVFSITGGDAPGKMVIHYDYEFSENGG